MIERRRNGFDASARSLLSKLQRLLSGAAEQAFAIGDVVNQLKSEHGLCVKEIAGYLGASRQRLSEMRRTAAAFPARERRHEVDFHFYTIAGRAARRLGMKPAAVLREVLKQKLQSTRQATAFLAQKIRERERLAKMGSAQSGPEDGDLINRCHHDDYRQVVARLEARSVNLVVADPPYGQYGRNRHGLPTTTAATLKNCDGLNADAAVELITDMFRLLLSRMARDGCLVLFRPGASADPVWLMSAAESHGWECKHAITWDKGGTKLGNARDPYSISTERLLVFVPRGGELQNHDGSCRSDVVRIAPISPRYVNGHNHHLFEKPAELCQLLVGKHSDPGDLVFEPFGGTGAVSLAAATMGRRWLYSETNPQNFQVGAERLLKATLATPRAVG